MQVLTERIETATPLGMGLFYVLVDQRPVHIGLGVGALVGGVPAADSPFWMGAKLLRALSLAGEDAPVSILYVDSEGVVVERCRLALEQSGVDDRLFILCSSPEVCAAVDAQLMCQPAFLAGRA